MPRLSIAIGCLGDSRNFEDTLASVLQNLPSGAELLVVHNSAYDDPYELAEEVTFLHLPAARSLTDLWKAAAEHASGEVLHYLASGLIVNEGWTTSPMQQLRSGDVVAVSPLVVSREDARTVIAAGVGYSSGGAREIVGAGKSPAECRGLSWKVVGPTLAAGFVKRDLLQSIAHDFGIVGDELADVDFGMLLKSAELDIALDTKCQITLADAEIAAGMQCRSNPLMQGILAERLFWRHAADSGLPVALAMHPLTILSEVLYRLPSLGSLLHLAGRVCGLSQMGAGSKAAETRKLLANWQDTHNAVDTIPLPVPVVQIQPQLRKAA